MLRWVDSGVIDNVFMVEMDGEQRDVSYNLAQLFLWVLHKTIISKQISTIGATWET